MDNLLALVTAMAISMALIPFMVRFARPLGLYDQPNDRKVHVNPIPRAGGVGIVIGGVLPLLFLLPLDDLTRSFILGSLILFVFGLWDDIAEIGHYPKFIGQVAAAAIVVFYGDLYVVSFPFVTGSELAPEWGKPFSMVAIVGMINAINHSDGLDGLAGGESLFSLGAFALLAFLVNDVTALTISLTVVGGIFGFLRYNTYPARVFMGDSGSQFLGFTVGFLAIFITQKVDTELSPAVVLLLLGLPIMDILVVLVKRIRSRSNMFEATRNHVHHRLLDLNFVHQETVIIIYSMQMIFVTSGILLRYQSNEDILAMFITLCVLIFGSISWLEHKGWKLGDRSTGRGGQERVMAHVVLRNALVIIPRKFLSISIPVYLVLTGLIVDKVPADFAKMSLLVCGLLLLEMFFGNSARSITRRALIYITAAFVGYLSLNSMPDWLAVLEPVNTIFFVLTALAFVLAVKFSPRRRKNEFQTTATDYLVAFCLLATLAVSKGDFWDSNSITFVVQMAVIFYGCELLITEKREKWGRLSTAALVTSGILALRGLVFV